MEDRRIGNSGGRVVGRLSGPGPRLAWALHGLSRDDSQGMVHSKMLGTRYKVPVSGDGCRLFLPGKPYYRSRLTFMPRWLPFTVTP